MAFDVSPTPEPARARIPSEAEAEVLRAEFFEAVGGEARWQRIMADRDAAEHYLLTHYDELLARFPNEEIAVHHDRVVFHASDPDEFGQLLEDYLARTGADPSSLEIHYLDPDPPLLAV